MAALPKKQSEHSEQRSEASKQQKLLQFTKIRDQLRAERKANQELEKRVANLTRILSQDQAVVNKLRERF